ncbi:MAG: ABC transporter ATP-binding protein [Castellaniella sp.]|uniref:ABC transporter ATP-binding protein n=1 Tax=Castellaniella sp. TaxID=1955812 RepID=UPI0012061597|nr:ABC transporter ATP-binding protein [Castellaniella sp.]TAN29094.1 MAG: ABC transporter ATP-binding protein [Castellaniella sp.]
MMAPILEARNVVKRYGRFTAVAGVSLQVQPHTVHAIIGPNGAGKTTLFHTLTGVVPLTSGAILLNGRDIGALAGDARVRLGMSRSFQVTSLFPTLTVQENLRVAAQGVRSREALHFWSTRLLFGAHRDLIDGVLERISLTACRDRLSSELSHGQQRRLEVGMALASRPQIILLDEPTSGMGVDDIGAMQEIIGSLRKDLTVLLIEHNMSIVMSISDTITVMQLGAVLVEGKPDQIKHDERVREAYLGKAGLKGI